MAHTLLREKSRQKFGIAPDRRSGRLSLRPALSRWRPRRQPEFFLNEIFRPSLLQLDYRSKTPVLAHLACTVSAPAGINATGT